MHDPGYIKVQDHAGLVRDRTTNAIIDVDHAEYQRYMQTKNARRQQLQQVESLEHRINNVEQNLSDIKSLLIKLLEERNGNHI